MDKGFDQVADEIQKAVLDDARRIYSEKVIDHYLHPRNAGGIRDADGFGKIKGPCGDTMSIYLRIDEQSISDAKFMTDGCGTTIACGSVVTDMARGKKIKEASKIRQIHVLEALGGLPDANIHCSVLAAATLRVAIKNYLLAQRSKGKDGRKAKKRG